MTNYLQRQIKQLNAYHRLALAGITGVIAFLSLFPLTLLSTRAIASWDVASGTYLLLAWTTMAGADADATRTSTTNRQSSRSILLLVLGAACISVAALAFMFNSGHGLPVWRKMLHITLSFLALALSWLLVHVRFAFHYAHRYYAGYQHMQASNTGGLAFPGGREPDYLDFAYFSFVIGMTSQVSDVAVTSRTMRRLALTHGLLSFAFNVAVLALSVNILASLI